MEILLEFTQHLKAFTNMTLSVRRALVATMVFAVVEKAGKETYAERRAIVCQNQLTYELVIEDLSSCQFGCAL